MRPLILFFVFFIAFQGYSLIAMGLGFDIYLAIISAQLIVILGGALFYRWKFASPKVSWPSLKKLGMPVWVLGVVIVASISIGLLGNVVAAAMVELFPTLKEMAEQYQETIERLLLSEGLRPQILGAISVAIVAPFCEEIFFRGTLLAEQRRAQTTLGVILLNGVLFSAMHGNPVAFVSLTIIGCYLAHITVYSGAIWAAIIGHSALNTVNGVLLPRVAQDLTTPEELAWTDILVALAILLPLTIALWWLSTHLIRRFSTDSSDEPTAVEAKSLG